MPDQYLIGNGAWCSCCFPKGRPDTSQLDPGRFATVDSWRERIRQGCNECAGKGRIGFSAEEIVAATVRENRAWRARA